MSEINIIDNIDDFEEEMMKHLPRVLPDLEDLDWILTKPAYNMNYNIYEYVLYALATFIMAQKLHEHVDNMFTCIMMSVSKAKALGVYHNAEETDPLWDEDSQAYDILPRLKELYIQGYRTQNPHEGEDPEWDDWWNEVKDFIPYLSM